MRRYIDLNADKGKIFDLYCNNGVSMAIAATLLNVSTDRFINVTKNNPLNCLNFSSFVDINEDFSIYRKRLIQQVSWGAMQSNQRLTRSSSYLLLKNGSQGVSEKTKVY